MNTCLSDVELKRINRLLKAACILAAYGWRLYTLLIAVTMGGGVVLLAIAPRFPALNSYMNGSRHIPRAVQSSISLYGWLIIGLVVSMLLFSTCLAAYLIKQLKSQRADVRLVGPLLDALQPLAVVDNRDLRVLSAVVDSLTDMLPQITSDNVHLLSRRQRSSLYKQLLARHAGNRSFAQAALCCVGVCGDQDALPVVRRICTQAKDDSTREIAVNCLTLLETRIARLQANEKQELLQASAAPASVIGDVLLRAANPDTGNVDTAEQLLRAGDR